MDGIHDLGGRQGFGPVDVDEPDEVFHEAWEGRVWGIVFAMTEHDSAKVQQIHRELHSHLPPEPALRVKALESLLVEKGMVDPRTVDAWIEVYTEDIGPKLGAQIVARAWTDPELKRRLLASGSEAIT